MRDIKIKLSTPLYYKLFWLFIIVYSFGYLLKVTNIIPSFMYNFIMLIGVFGFSFFYFKLKNLKIENKYLRIVFTLYFLWQIYVILQGFKGFEKNTIAWFLFYPYTLLSYLVPLVVLIPFEISFLKTLFNNFYKLSISFLILAVLTLPLLIGNMNYGEEFVWTLGTGAGFLILTIDYQKKLHKIIAYATVFVSLIVVSYLARRNIIFTFGNYIIFSFLIYIFNSNISLTKRLKKIILFSMILCVIGMFFILYQNVLFGELKDRISVNSREEVFLGYFFDMTSQDWLIGKGMEGKYYMPGVDEDEVDRYLIENGYLFVILKGGIVSLFLFLMISIPAAVLGLTKSKNIVGKAAGAIVFLWILDMFVWGIPSINIRYILFWTSISICFTKDFRLLTDDELKFKLKSIKDEIIVVD